MTHQRHTLDFLLRQAAQALSMSVRFGLLPEPPGCLEPPPDGLPCAPAVLLDAAKSGRAPDMRATQNSHCLLAIQVVLTGLS